MFDRLICFRPSVRQHTVNTCQAIVRLCSKLQRIVQY